MPGPLTEYRIGGDLGRFYPVAGTDWAPTLTLSRSKVELPGRPGYTTVGIPKVEAPPLTLKFSPGARSQTELETKRNELVGLLSEPSSVIQRVSGSQVTEAQFVLESLSYGDFYPGIKADIDAVLSIPGGAFRSLAHTDHAAPVGTTSLPIRGTAPVYDAVVRFAGPFAGTATITDTATGTGISWSGSLFQGQYAFVNVGRMRAHVGAATSWGTGSDVSAGVDYPPAGRLVLWGRNGAPLGSYTVPDDDRLLAGQQLTQDPTTLLWYKTETAGGSQPLPSTRTVTVRVTGAPAVIRAKEAWL